MAWSCLPMPPTVHRSESLRRREAIASGTRIAATTPQETVTASHRETAPKVKIASSTKMVSHGHTKATVTPVVKPTAVAPAKPAPAASVSASGGPVGASIGLIKQMESMNRAPANDMSSNEMFKNFGF